MGIQGIRQFFQSRLSTPEPVHKPDAVAIAACALLLEMAHADEVLDENERARILRAVREDLGAPAADVDEDIRPRARGGAARTAAGPRPTGTKPSASPRRRGVRASTFINSRNSSPKSSRA